MRLSPESINVRKILHTTLFALSALALRDEPVEDSYPKDRVRVASVGRASIIDFAVLHELATTTTTEQPTTTTLATTTTAPRPAPRPAPTPEAPPIVDEQRAQLLAESGVAEADHGYVDYIFTKESGWRTDAVNGGGCIGLGQNCPDRNGERWLEQACPDWQTNPVCQIRRFQDYAIGKYGSWQEAYETKISTGIW